MLQPNASAWPNVEAVTQDPNFPPPVRGSWTRPATDLEFDGDGFDAGEPFIATDLEVVTVTATSVVICWVTRRPRAGIGVPAPVATNTQVKLGFDASALKLVYDDPTPRCFHYVHIDGLQPGRCYRFEARSNGVAPTPALRVTSGARSPEVTGVFTTLTPPPGRYLGSVALSNDVHLGETRQGINLGPLPTSVRAEPDEPAYPEVMFTAMLAQLRARHNPFVVLAGDLTYNATARQVDRLLELGNSYGPQNQAWLGLRGNHDYPRRIDHFGQVAPYQQLQTVRLDWGLRILGIDSTRKSSGGWISDQQFEQIESELRTDPDRPTLSCTHHPVTTDAAWSSISGPQFMLRAPDRRRLQQLHAQAPGVFAHHSGHSHRMRLDKPDIAGAHTQYFENAACGAYPCGFSLLHLFSGGYQLNFWRTCAPQAQRWIYRSRFQMMGIGPQFMLGHLGDRNFTREFDFSGLQPSGMRLPDEFEGAL